MKQRMEKLISTIREKARKSGVIRKAVGLGMAVMMILEVIIASSSTSLGMMPSAADELTVIHGSYEMVRLGTEPEIDVTPDTLENNEPENPADAEETDFPSTSTSEEAEAAETSAPTVNPIIPENPEKTEDNPVVETTMSLLSSSSATIMLRRAAALSINKTEGLTIYFDTSGNGSWNSGDDGWTKDAGVYVYFYNSNGVNSGNVLKPMTRTDLQAEEPNGVIWSINLTERDANTYQYIIFICAGGIIGLN